MIDFGETVDVLVENIFKIVDEDKKNKIYSIPALAFQCTIASIRPSIHGKLESNWSDEANNILKPEKDDYWKHTYCGTVRSFFFFV